MFCPNCADKRESDASQFCRGCGHSFAVEETSRNGLKQGFVLIAVGLLLIPVWMFIGAAFPPNDRLVESSPSTTRAEQIAWILMWIAFVSAAARIAYTVIFERVSNANENIESASLPRARNNSLPSADTFEGARPGKWRTTGDLQFVTPKKRVSGDL